MPQMALDIKLETRKLREMYNNDARQQTFNLLLLGESGSGKTYSLRTARKPIHVDSFDPGGTKNLRPLVNTGEAILDTRWEAEDPKNPTVYTNWTNEFKARIASGYFNHFGTYVIDSATTWAETIMNSILKKANMAGQAPRYTHDYVPQKVEIINCLQLCLNLPCDFILTGHLEVVKDETGGQPVFRFMTTGKAQVTIPLKFDEVWVMDPKDSSDGVKYQMLMQSTGRHLARSRLAAGIKLAKHETPDIKAILKKVGFDVTDKPLLI